jgi:hypothetical protein
VERLEGKRQRVLRKGHRWWAAGTPMGIEEQGRERGEIEERTISGGMVHNFFPSQCRKAEFNLLSFVLEESCFGLKKF